MKRAIGLAIVLLASAPALFAQPQFRNAGAMLITETVTNKVIESRERVTVSVALQNVGNQVASNLVATIRSGGGVLTPVPLSQNYGRLAPAAPSVAREFAFTADGPSGLLLRVNLDLNDSGRNLGLVSFRFRIGPQITPVEKAEPITIMDRSPGLPYPSVLSVSNVPGSISSVTVTLMDLSHSFPDDLDILLTSPSGDAVMLMSDACGTTDLDETLTFSDLAEQVLPDSGTPISLLVRPTNHDGIAPDLFPLPAPAGPYAEALSTFNGKTANGDWKLYIVDDGASDSGLLEDGWSLTITTLQPVDALPTLTLLPRTNIHTIRFAISGRPGNTYAVESSPDPLRSIPIESFLMPASGIRHFEFPIGPTDRFFRAATDP